MREHDGIIKIESLLVKSMDEREFCEVASRSIAALPSLKRPNPKIFVDKILASPYNPLQFNQSSEL